MLSENFYQALAGGKANKKEESRKRNEKKWKDELKLEIIEK